MLLWFVVSLMVDGGCASIGSVQVQDFPLASWLERDSASSGGMAILLSKLHGCINQLEQFPVRVHDLPGRRYVCVEHILLVCFNLNNYYRGSQALKFFNSHQIKCTLERHPSAVDTNQWKGGVLRIDPLATIQVNPAPSAHLPP